MTWGWCWWLLRHGGAGANAYSAALGHDGQAAVGGDDHQVCDWSCPHTELEEGLPLLKILLNSSEEAPFLVKQSANISCPLIWLIF